MSEQLALRIIANYVQSTLDLRENSAVPASLADANIDVYRTVRSEVYLRWENAKESLRELPLEYKIQAIEAIDQITA